MNPPKISIRQAAPVARQMIAASAETVEIKRKQRMPEIPKRRLRVYALDPSLAKTLESVAVNQTVLSVPWDDSPLTRDPLIRGPVGEYLEVVDVDPASNRVYEPVDLNDKALLAQDGWPPSEGNPQFHQQMVYAVAMTTIGHFERALGRRALWAARRATTTAGSPGKTADGRKRSTYLVEEVRRLRIYPHALRTNNAYYSPEKKALLFGYFPAESTNSDSTAPGSMVFSCLSSDIIAHETTHALLDGLHRRFQEASNPDVPAFHEAFADVVALFQHFTITELVRFAIERARGDLSAASMLAGLAEQFGEGSSRGGPLRNYLDPAIRALNYDETLEPHDRGSILVFAIYEAFLKIVARHTQSTIRIASGGSGILPEGSLHPDLVDRLTRETCATAQYVLHMCIRALDYAPSADITFGEYLRALITADRDLVPEDPYGHRVAFMESFQARGILPRDVRSISEESLAWGTLEESRPSWLRPLMQGVVLNWDQDLDRSEIFRLNEDNRWVVWRGLKQAFRKDPSLYKQFGLVPDLPAYDEQGKIRHQPSPGESTFDVYSVRPARRIAPDGSFRTEVIAVIHQRRPIPLDGNGGDVKNGFFWFRGGATLIVDPREGKEEIRYSILKSVGSQTRLERQRQYTRTGFLSPLQALYFGGGDDLSPGKPLTEPFAMMHADSGD
jgi:hypothetical protein